MPFHLDCLLINVLNCTYWGRLQDAWHIKLQPVTVIYTSRIRPQSEILIIQSSKFIWYTPFQCLEHNFICHKKGNIEKINK